MLKKFASITLAVVMLVSLAVPASASFSDEWIHCCDKSLDDAIVIEVNSMDELFDVLEQRRRTEDTVIITLGPDLDPEEVALELSRVLPAILSIIVGGWVVSQVVDGVFIHIVGTSPPDLVNWALGRFRAGVRGNVTWTGNSRCCCWP